MFWGVGGGKGAFEFDTGYSNNIYYLLFYLPEAKNVFLLNKYMFHLHIYLFAFIRIFLLALISLKLNNGICRPKGIVIRLSNKHALSRLEHLDKKFIYLKLGLLQTIKKFIKLKHH